MILAIIKITVRYSNELMLQDGAKRFWAILDRQVFHRSMRDPDSGLWKGRAAVITDFSNLFDSIDVAACRERVTNFAKRFFTRARDRLSMDLAQEMRLGQFPYLLIPLSRENETYYFAATDAPRPGYCTISFEDLVFLLQCGLACNYTTALGRVYKRDNGVPTGFPACTLLANIYLAELEWCCVEDAIARNALPLSKFADVFRYVDDSICHEATVPYLPAYGLSYSKQTQPSKEFVFLGYSVKLSESEVRIKNQPKRFDFPQYAPFAFPNASSVLSSATHYWGLR